MVPNLDIQGTQSGKLSYWTRKKRGYLDVELENVHVLADWVLGGCWIGKGTSHSIGIDIALASLVSVFICLSLADRVVF